MKQLFIRSVEQLNLAGFAGGHEGIVRAAVGHDRAERFKRAEGDGRIAGKFAVVGHQDHAVAGRSDAPLHLRL